MYVGKTLSESYEFDRKGQIKERYTRREEEAKEYSDRPSTSRTDMRKDSSGRIVGSSFYEHGQLYYTDSFIYDNRGNATHILRTEPGLPAYIHSATTYDEHNNQTEVILGGNGINSGANRWVTKYDDAGHKLTERQYQWFTQLYRLDSSTYNEHGKMTGHYSYGYKYRQPVLEDRYVWAYDPSTGNLLGMTRYAGIEQKLWERDRYTYNGLGQLIEHSGYNYYGVEYPYTFASFRYNSKGLLIEKKEYLSDRDFQYVELPKPAVIKWVYSFYK